MSQTQARASSAITHLDLFTGIGGFHLAATWAGFDTLGFSEIDSYCCALLQDKWPAIHNYGDLRRADFSPLIGRVTVLSAGVPCQPASQAGRRKGQNDDRWLWPSTLDVVRLLQPAWCIFENPDGILTMDEFGGVLLRLEALGYSFRLFRVPANAVGAKHRRYRVFVVAHREMLFGTSLQRGEPHGANELLGTRSTAAHADSAQRRPQECRDNVNHGQESQRRQSPDRFEGSSDKTVAHSECIGSEGGKQNPRIWHGSNGSGEESEAMADAKRGELQRWGKRGDLGDEAPEEQREGNQRERTRDAASDSSEAMADAERFRLNTEFRQQEGQQLRSGREAWSKPATSGNSSKTLADTNDARLQGRNESRECSGERIIRESGQPISFPRLTEPPLCRATDGIPHRSHRLKALGNSVVPQQAFPFFQAIAQLLQP